MKVMVIEDTENSRLEIAVQDKDVVSMAHLLETHKSIKGFYVDGMNVKNQQKVYGVGDFEKWKSPIQQ